MKKIILLLAAAVILLTASVAAAESPYELDAGFLEEVRGLLSVRVNWNRTIDDDGTFVSITEKGVIHGYECEYTVIGYPDRAYQVCLTVPFSRLTMNRDAVFSDELFIYNAVYHQMLKLIPDNFVPDSIFSSYEIQSTVRNGYSYAVSDPLPDGWQWIRKEPGYLWIKKTDYPACYCVSVHLLDNGMIWFDIELD